MISQDCQATTAHMAADKEAVSLSGVHMDESKCIQPSRDTVIVYSVLEHNLLINTTRMNTIS